MSNLAITATWTFSRSKGAQRLLQLLIADAIYTDKGYADVDVRRLAFRANCSPRYVRMLILKQIGAGELVGAMVDKDGGTWYRFWVPVYKGETGYDDQPCDSEAEEHICCGHHTPLYIDRDRLYEEKGRQARKGAGSSKSSRRIRPDRGVINSVDNLPDYPQKGNDSSGGGGNDSSLIGNDSSLPGNHSSLPGNNRSDAYKKTHIYPDITQIDPGASHHEKASKLSRADLEAWATSTEGAAFVKARGYRGEIKGAGTLDLRAWHRAWTLKGAAR